MPAATDALPAPSPQVLFTELDDGTGVLLHLDTKFYFTLNRTAVFVWKALGSRAGESRRALAEEITRAFRVELDAAERDLGLLLEELLADGLAEPTAPR